MTGQEALKLVDRLLQTSNHQGLTDLQTAILLSACEKQSYQVLADRLDYELDYIKQVAARLWKQIAQIVGEDACKANIQSVLRRYQQTHEVQINHKVMNWGEMMNVSRLDDRHSELQTIEIKAIADHEQFIGIFGLVGIGETSYAPKLAQILQDQFDCVIGQSLRQTLLLQELVNVILPTLTSMNLAGKYEKNFADYCQLVESICDESFQCCFVLAMVEKPTEIAKVEEIKLSSIAIKEANKNNSGNTARAIAN